VICRNTCAGFTDREQSYLFQAVQLYVTPSMGATESSSTATTSSLTSTSIGGGSHSGVRRDSAVTLLEDALKMPFTVFGEISAVTQKWHVMELTAIDNEVL
jgi:hypothetical protein